MAAVMSSTTQTQKQNSPGCEEKKTELKQSQVYQREFLLLAKSCMADRNSTNPSQLSAMKESEISLLMAESKGQSVVRIPKDGGLVANSGPVQRSPEALLGTAPPAPPPLPPTLPLTLQATLQAPTPAPAQHPRQPQLPPPPPCYQPILPAPTLAFAPLALEAPVAANSPLMPPPMFPQYCRPVMGRQSLYHGPVAHPFPAVVRGMLAPPGTAGPPAWHADTHLSPHAPPPSSPPSDILKRMDDDKLRPPSWDASNTRDDSSPAASTTCFGSDSSSAAGFEIDEETTSSLTSDTENGHGPDPNEATTKMSIVTPSQRAGISLPPGLEGFVNDINPGSEAHKKNECRPCAWFHKAAGCASEKECKFCHVCPSGAVKQRKKQQRAGRKLAQALNVKCSGRF